ncbi:MAG TPA: cardiolipin synthase [Clostridia bacterium]|nr:cardiolipin synthase [Clostridia bacterium]
MKKLIKVLISRAFLVGAAILIQAFTLIIVIWRFTNYFIYFYSICAMLSLLAVLWILNGKSYPAYKLAWIIPIMVFPIFGGLFYLMLGGNRSSKRNKRNMQEISRQMMDFLKQDEEILQQLERENRGAANQAKYTGRYSLCPVYTNTTTEYLTPGEKKFERLLEELKKAERYIFLEYYIIEEGIMWNSILEILKEKAKQGVEVRVIYDDVGCLLTLPFGYNKKLEQLGIKCSVFNPFMPVMTVRLNNRDHRKIAVIDGHTAFTGGINLADEYINAYEKYGYWKDSAIIIHGDAVWSLTVMFLSMWNYLRNIDEDFEAFKPSSGDTGHFAADGFVQPFADSPLDDEAVSQSVYLNLIGKAEKYVYITTPYLILDNEMTTALCLAAKRGVDVRIITPHIPDKWYVHAVSRSNYEVLLESEVSIYEFTPGFIHSKTFAVDDIFAVVGTINLDYRSLYLHFECGVWMYRTKSVMEVKEDYLHTLEACETITYGCCKSIIWYRKLGRLVLRLFAPLM